jgi:hypothetical protein
MIRFRASGQIDDQDHMGIKIHVSRSRKSHRFVTRQRFVRLAMDALVDFDLAEKTAGDEYLIKYKRTKVDTLKKFGRLCFQRERQLHQERYEHSPRLLGI